MHLYDVLPRTPAFIHGYAPRLSGAERKWRACSFQLMVRQLAPQRHQARVEHPAQFPAPELTEQHASLILVRGRQALRYGR